RAFPLLDRALQGEPEEGLDGITRGRGRRIQGVPPSLGGRRAARAAAARMRVVGVVCLVAWEGGECPERAGELEGKAPRRPPPNGVAELRLRARSRRGDPWGPGRCRTSRPAPRGASRTT